MATVSRPFWNLSNHPVAETWSEAQVAAARTWEGASFEPQDVPFPAVEPTLDTGALSGLALATLRHLVEAGGRPGDPVLVQGEFSLTFHLVRLLAERGFQPVTATSRRVAEQRMHPDGRVDLVHQFRFVRFRRYLER